MLEFICFVLGVCAFVSFVVSAVEEEPGLALLGVVFFFLFLFSVFALSNRNDTKAKLAQDKLQQECSFLLQRVSTTRDTLTIVLARPECSPTRTVQPEEVK